MKTNLNELVFKIHSHLSNSLHSSTTSSICASSYKSLVVSIYGFNNLSSNIY